jgi:hypothetical protein
LALAERVLLLILRVAGTKRAETGCSPSTAGKNKAMTARQFLLSESSYSRQRAASCPDPFLAEELRRLAECFERTADTAQLDKTPGDDGREQQDSRYNRKEYSPFA